MRIVIEFSEAQTVPAVVILALSGEVLKGDGSTSAPVVIGHWREQRDES